MTPKKKYERFVLRSEEFRKRIIRSLALGGVFIIFGGALSTWILSGEEGEGIPRLFRKVLEFNGQIGSSLYRSGRVPNLPPKPPVGKPPRVNGDLGLDGEVDENLWKMNVVYQRGSQQEKKLTLSMSDIRWLPKTETVTEFKCIEGWSEVMWYAGVRFSEFMKHYDLKYSKYVGFVTPDQEYYVSLDMDSMMHSQTILAYEMNGVGLSQENGAPLRLVVPIKYGIKSLKRIGTIIFSDTRPPDYWAERGYDWYSGL